MPSTDPLDRLFDALRQSDVPLPAPTAPGLLRDLAGAIAPLELPEDLQTFWERADPRTMRVSVWPGLCDLEFSVNTWREDRRGVHHVPAVLLPFCYSSHCFLSVELHGEARLGGPVWYHAYDDFEFSSCFPSVTAWIDLLTTMIELGEYERYATDGGDPVLLIDAQRWKEAAAVRLAQSLPHPTYGSNVVFDDHVTAWPAHWLQATGLSLDDRRARGTTTTIAALVEAAAHGRAEGTIRGRVIASAGQPFGMRLTVDDGTGTLVVWCPASATQFYLGESGPFELDVVVTGPAAPSDPTTANHDVVRAAYAHDMQAAQEAGRRLHDELFGRGFNAVAQAVRPVEG